MTRDLMTWSGIIGRARAPTFCGASHGARCRQRLLFMLGAKRSRRRSPSARAVVAVAGVAVLIAGCGGGSSLTVASMPGVSTTGRHLSSSKSSGDGAVRFVGGAPSPAQQAEAQVAQLKFSRCMRSHGVPNFPDPPSASGGGFGLIFGGSGIDFAAPLFRKAQRSCISSLTHQRVVVR
jgi:hypothetical protein